MTGVTARSWADVTVHCCSDARIGVFVPTGKWMLLSHLNESVVDGVERSPYWNPLDGMKFAAP